MNIILKSIKRFPALTIAADYLLDEDLKVIWRGKAATESTLYLVYGRKKVTAEQVSLMREYTSIK